MTAYEDGTAQVEDPILLQRATELDRVFFAQDTDLLAFACEWQKSGREFAGLFYGHRLQLTIGQAVRYLELAAGVLAPEDMKNRVEHLPL